MAAPLPLRRDYDAPKLRSLARRSRDADQTRRLLALALIYDGGSRSAAAQVGGVGLQIVRDWVLHFNADGPVGLVARKAQGPTPKLTIAQRKALEEKVGCGPIPAVDGVVRWRLKDLAQWIFQEFGISLDETTIGRELKAMGFRKLSARPKHHEQNEQSVEDFKKNFPPAWQRCVPACHREQK